MMYGLLAVEWYYGVNTGRATEMYTVETSHRHVMPSTPPLDPQTLSGKGVMIARSIQAAVVD